MPAARIQPQGRVRLNRNSPLFRGLIGAFTPPGPGVTPVGGALMKIGRNGEGYSTNASAESWLASNTALASAWPTWTILAILDGTSTNSDFGGAAIYAERPNGTQIVKLGFGDSNSNKAMLVVRDAGNRLALFSGTANVKTDASIPRILVGTRRASNDHRLYFNGALDSSASGDIPGPFNATNCIIGNDPQDGRANLGGAAVPLVLVWNRSLTDAEIALISANPWQVFDGQAPMLYAAAGGTNATATPSGVSASSVVGSVAASGQGRASPAGVSAAASAGSPIASGQGRASPVGVSASASVGTATAAGSTVISATASPAGVSAAAAVGNPAASGAANSAATGVSAVASVGTVSASGATVINGSASAAGVSAASAVGAPAASGTASAAPAGVSATASVGSVSASGATVVHGNAAPAGVSASSAVGSVAANGTARATPSGVQAAAAVGTASANGGVSVAGNAQPAGVAAVASVGTPSASGATVVHGNASAAGVAAAASVGTVTVSASAKAMPAGVSVLATIGQPIASGQIQMNGTALPAGVVAYTYVGQVQASSMTFARAPAGPGYSRPFTNTTRPHQVNTRRTR